MFWDLLVADSWLVNWMSGSDVSSPSLSSSVVERPMWWHLLGPFQHYRGQICSQSLSLSLLDSKCPGFGLFDIFCCLQNSHTHTFVLHPFTFTQLMQPRLTRHAYFCKQLSLFIWNERLGLSPLLVTHFEPVCITEKFDKEKKRFWTFV